MDELQKVLEQFMLLEESGLSPKTVFAHYFQFGSKPEKAPGTAQIAAKYGGLYL